MKRPLILIGLAPFIVGALIPVHVVMNGDPLCPFRELTGLPCPLCGATRAFVLLMHGDGRWIDYGAVWVLFAAALVLAVRRVPMIALVSVGAVAWVWALAHTSTIT